MTYLSRIWLNPLRTRTQSFLRNRQALHAAILCGLSRQPVTERVLWRLETTDRHRLTLLVLTESRPSWEHLIEQGGWPGSDDPQALVKAYQPLLDQVARGRQFAFRLHANPVGSTKKPAKPSPVQRDRLAAPGRSRGVRLPHRTAGYQLTWLQDRLERWGFQALTNDHGPTAYLVARERLSFHKHDGDKSRRITLATATFEGVVEVVDPQAARRSLLDGVGPGKAYGMGLITLAPPRPSDPEVVVARRPAGPAPRQ
jgi:CRISPR system Cascade subunit CasE